MTAAADGSLKDKTGNVFQIQHFSIHDGPGIRSTVFLKGCPLRCVWCHNPEGQQSVNRIVFVQDKCRLCGACSRVCPCNCHVITQTHTFHAELCRNCGACAAACPFGAMQQLGEQMTAEAVLREVCKDQSYFEASGGGITLSGGEPTMQPEFLLAVLKLAGQRKLHRAVETCGYAPWETFASIAPETDLFLFDCKETDSDRHLALTGVPLDGILENLRRLHDTGAKILLRCPIVPGCNERQEHFEALARLCSELPRLQGIELLAYHSLGVSKAERYGFERQKRFEVPDKERLKRWNALLRSLGAPVIDS